MPKGKAGVIIGIGIVSSLIGLVLLATRAKAEEEEVAPAEIVLSNLQYSPKYGQRAQETTLSVTATNLGNVTAARDVRVSVWPSVLLQPYPIPGVMVSYWDKTIILAPYETKVIDLGGFYPTQTGTYQVKVDGLGCGVRVVS